MVDVKALTIEELKLLIHGTVTETIESPLNDPDRNKHLRPEAKKCHPNLNCELQNTDITMI